MWLTLKFSQSFASNFDVDQNDYILSPKTLAKWKLEPKPSGMSDGENIIWNRLVREAVKNVLADFFPLTENHFAKKTLTERGGTPPSPNRKSPKIILKNGPKKG